VNAFDCTTCFYSADSNAIIDVIRPDTGLSWFAADNLESMRQRYPDAIVMDIGTAAELKETQFKSDVIEITEAQYWEMLECLPPMDYSTFNGWSSFKMSELTCGNITGIYATNGEKFYHFSDSQFTKHQDIIARCTQ